MKITQIIICSTLALTLFASCNNSGKKGESGDSTESSGGLFGSSNDKEEADAIIEFNNRLVRVENSHNTYIRNFMNAVDGFEKFVQTKLANPNAVAIPPILITPVIVGGMDNLKAPNSLKGNYSEWIDSLTGSFEALKRIHKELDAYKSAEDWKEDKGKKIEDIKVRALAEINKNRNASKSLFVALKPEAEKAEEKILKDHPLKDQIITARQLMDYTQKITEGTYQISDMNSFKATLESQYKELETMYNKSKDNPIKDEKFASENRMFTSFNDEINEYLGKLRIIQRELNETGNVSESNLETLDRSTQSVVSSYNSFVN